MKAWIIALIVVLIIVVGVVLAFRSGGDEGPARPPVTVSRGTVVRTAVATGRIQPAYEVIVRSQFSGLVAEHFAKLGDRVEVGHPLVDVRGVVTQLDLIQARRGVESAERTTESAREFVEGSHLAAWVTRFVFGGAQIDRLAEEAELGKQRAEESLEFLETGKLKIAGEEVDTIVRAPVAGHVIDLIRATGERVTPVGSFQPATEIATIADMDHLEFRGTVDEIDVGKLKPGLSAEISIGALPETTLSGTLQDVGRKAKTVNNATVFDVWIDIENADGAIMRAGYSATAEVSVDRRENVLVLPERVITYREDGAFVNLPGPDGKPTERAIEVGLGDGLVIEVTEGLKEGDLVLEREYPTLE
jgi:HlyD family secretion protein